MPDQKKVERRRYVRPVITEITERELLETIGPAQGYGQAEKLDLDSEWTRRS